MMKMVVKILIALVLVGALTFLSVLTAVCLCAGRTFETKPADCIIVLGAHVWMDGRMSNALLYRCEAALEAWKRGIAPNIIVCGSQGRDEPEAEAVAMRHWMLDHGVPEDRVIAEPDSVNTMQNLQNARAIMDARGWRTAAVCSNNYHLTRALWLARDAGLEATGIAAPSTRDPVSFARGRLRETCSWILYFLRRVF
jgi:uncharacterized SAM-binding protein YcdF (DUF218 family)